MAFISLRTGRMALAVVAVVASAACGGSSTPASAPQLSAQQLLDGSATRMGAVDSFRFKLENEGGETPLPTGLAMRSAQGVMVKPDRLDLQVKALFAGFSVEVRVVNVGPTTYVTDPLTAKWDRYESALSPAAFFDPVKGINSILKDVTDATLDGEASVGGVQTYQLRGKLPAQSVQFLAGSYAEGSVLEAVLNIAKENYLLRQVRLTGQLTAEERPGISRTLTFSDFGQAFDVRPPA